MELNHEQKKMLVEMGHSKFLESLKRAGMEIDHHCEFVSVLKNKESGIVVAEISDNGDLEWV